MKSHLLVLVAGLSLGFFAACGTTEAAPETTEASASALGDSCPCGSAGGGSCLPCHFICGDGFCDGANGENVSNCPDDCAVAPYCTDGICNGGETWVTCPQDCAMPTPWCGDGVCNGGEGPVSCPADCGNTCGNGLCEFGEASWCFVDCVPGCQLDPSVCPQVPQG
ncbi:tenascin-X [Myxococcus sp. K38C18041901]|uniref:tenascin-X n=1 Tax=Myxococcus guangdongensis TaxID=2906760 RepID=UPI0020A72BC0|nr:tenascin-X [Myxococcus guangdongensis]MCP3059056.1 tenascin-X [Myxococcus guangdongensis]